MGPRSMKPEDAVHTRKCFYIGGEYQKSEGQHADNDANIRTTQMYVEELKPILVMSPYPIIFWHGMCQTGASWVTTPDERPGWASYFVWHGYTVYLVDSPERGRSAHLPGSSKLVNVGADYVEKFWTATSGNGGLWPQAGLHTQWPGNGRRGDPIFDAFMNSQVQSRNDYLAAEVLAQKLGAELLKRTGPAFLCTHSAGGSHGWMIADAVPHLVKSIVALEPVGPPFVNRLASIIKRPDPDEISRPYGLTIGPVAFDPPIEGSQDLQTITQPTSDADLCDIILQTEPPRKLTNLMKVPVLLMTSEAGYHSHYDYATVAFLRQAGVDVTWLNLPTAGTKGNGHFMFMEKNNLEVADHILKWFASKHANEPYLPWK